jgi:hypothetical protein
LVSGTRGWRIYDYAHRRRRSRLPTRHVRHFGQEQAKGEFLTVKLRVTNIGDEARTYWADNQKLIVNSNTYEPSSTISDDSWRQEINPGLSIDTDVTFDIPPGAVPEQIVLHDSAFSGGAHLAL